MNLVAEWMWIASCCIVVNPQLGARIGERNPPLVEMAGYAFG